MFRPAAVIFPLNPAREPNWPVARQTQVRGFDSRHHGQVTRDAPTRPTHDRRHREIETNEMPAER